MNVDPLEFGSFRLTGSRPGRETPAAAISGLRPALFAGYEDLSKLRYDYPLVLVEERSDDGFACALSAIVDGILQEIAPRGAAGERLRQDMLKLEQALRTLVTGGNGETLSQLWDRAERDLLSECDEAAREPLRANVSRARGALQVDGQVVGCDDGTPVMLLTHAWRAAQRTKARAFREKVEDLILRLSGILEADFMKSEAARTPSTLKSSVGTAYEGVFDFEAMSRVLAIGSSNGQLPEARRRRIEAALSVLQLQRFHAPSEELVGQAATAEPHSFIFKNCAAALDAYRARLSEMVEVIKAISVAELEIQNRYQASRHDPVFERFDESALSPDDLALFPSYLVCLRDHGFDPAETARILEVLASELPIKILVQADDILGGALASADSADPGNARARLASMALGLNSAFVLQAASSALHQLRQPILEGLSCGGPALFRLFSGSAPATGRVPPYLLAASAIEARAFPVFAYDRAAGPDWASRFSIAENPQLERAWPVHNLSYEDQDHQRIVEEVAFTFADLAACDRRFDNHFAHVPRAQWDDGMIPVGAYLDLTPEQAASRVPCVLMVDQDSRLHRLAVDDKLIRWTRRCAESWRGLQELGGIDSSLARRLLEQERALWEQEKERELAALRNIPEPEPGAPAVTEATAPRETASPAAPSPQAPVPEAPGSGATAEAEAAEAADAPPDDPYIETARCTTCNECTDINNRMFVYDDNMQAYILDPDLGTYRQLVEAAETCQVSIIHPGKPRNSDEPNLEELIERAASFT
jgi:ferredoxin